MSRPTVVIELGSELMDQSHGPYVTIKLHKPMCIYNGYEITNRFVRKRLHNLLKTVKQIFPRTFTNIFFSQGYSANHLNSYKK